MGGDATIVTNQVSEALPLLLFGQKLIFTNLPMSGKFIIIIIISIVLNGIVDEQWLKQLIDNFNVFAHF